MKLKNNTKGGIGIFEICPPAKFEKQHNLLCMQVYFLMIIWL